MPATAQIKIAADTVQFRNSMRDVEKTMNKLSSITQRTQSSLSGLFRTMGRTSALGLFVGLPTTLVASQRSFQKFEKQILEVFTLLPNANRAMLQKLKNDAIGFSMDYGISKEEAAMGMYQSISAGQSPMGLTEGFMKVAQESAIAGVTDLRTAVDALTNVINSYGEGMYDVGYVADRMFHAVSMSKTTFRELADYMYQIIPTAAAMKVRFDDLMGSISAMAATGTLTRVGTTQLRQFLIELSREGDKSNLAFLQGSGGVPIQKFIKEGGRLTEVIHIMGEVARKRRTDLRNLFGSVEAGNAALTLYNSRAYKGMVKALEEDADGAMSVAFEKIMGSQEKRIDRVKEAFMSVFTRIGEVIKPMIDDILTYFEGVADKIRNYKWSKLADNFNIAWYKIKTAVQDGKFWDIFSTGANLAFTKIKLFIEDSIKPMLREVTDQMALLFSQDTNYSFGEDLLSMLKGVGSYLLSLAKDFGVELMDAFKAPMSFMASALKASALNMFDAFASTLPDFVKEQLGIKGKEERERDQRRENLSQAIQSGGVDIGVINDVYKGKALEDIETQIKQITEQIANMPLGSGYGQRIKELMLERAKLESEASKYAGMSDLYDEETYAGGSVSKWVDDKTDGLIYRPKYDKPVMERLMKDAIYADPLPGLDFSRLLGMTDLEDIYASRNMLPPEVDIDKEYGRYKNPAGRILEYKMPPEVREQYREDIQIPRKGYTLFGGLDRDKFMSGEMSKDYEIVLERLQSTIGKLEAQRETLDNFSPQALSDLNILKDFYDSALERRNKIFDMVFQKEVLDGKLPKERGLMEFYKDASSTIEEGIGALRNAQEDVSKKEKEDAIAEIKNSLDSYKEKRKKLKEDAEKLEAVDSLTPPSTSVEGKDEFGLPIMSLPLSELNLKIASLEKQLSKMVTDLGMPDPLPKEEDADTGKPLHEISKEEPKPFEVAPKIPDVKGDNMTKVGGGGGFFSYKFSPIDRNTDAINKSKESMDELRDAIKKRTMKGEKLLLETILPQIPIDTPQHVIDSEVNENVDQREISKINEEIKNKIVNEEDNQELIDHLEKKSEEEFLKKVQNSTLLNVIRDHQKDAFYQHEVSKDKKSSSVMNETEENVEKKIVPPTQLEIDMREKLKNKPDYKYSDEHLQDALKIRKQSVTEEEALKKNSSIIKESNLNKSTSSVKDSSLTQSNKSTSSVTDFNSTSSVKDFDVIKSSTKDSSSETSATKDINAVSSSIKDFNQLKSVNSVTNQESESNSVKESSVVRNNVQEAPYVKPLIDLSSIVNEKNISKESVKESEKTSQNSSFKESEKTSQINRVFNESNDNNKNSLSENYKSFKSNIFDKTSEESKRNVFNQSNPIQPKFSKVGFESPSQQQQGLGGVEMVKLLNDSASSLKRAANRLENLTPSVENIEPINFA